MRNFIRLQGYVFPAVWLSPRGVSIFFAFAGLVAVASVVGWLVIVSYAAAILLVVVIAVDLRLGPSRRSLRVMREAIPHLVLGRRASVAYAVENRSALTVRIGLIETPSALIAFECEILTATVAAHARVTIEQGLVAQDRGRVHFGKIFLWADSSVGILRRRFVVDSQADGDVFPDLSSVDHKGLLASRKTLIDRGVRKARLRGIGSEFESLREYAPGDSFRSVDWKATAHRGRMFVQQYEVERSRQVIVTLDCGRLMTARMSGQRKFDFALTAGLSLARAAQEVDDHIGLLAFSVRPILSIAPRRGRAHVSALVRAAFDLQPRMEEPDYERLFTELEHRCTKRSLIVLFTDIFDPVLSAARLNGMRRLARRNLVLCVFMNDAAIAGALERVPQDTEQAYRAGVAMKLADEREAMIARIRSLGVIVVDVPASQLTLALLNTYLDIKVRARM